MNVNAPNGLTPVRHVSGAPYNGATNLYWVPATDNTDIFIGDVVRILGTADPTGKYPVVTQGSATARAVGVCVGVALDTTQPGGAPQDSPIFRRGGTGRLIHVVDDPTVLFSAQEDSVGGDIVVADVGQNVTFTTTAGSQFSGISAMEIDSSTISAGSTVVLKLIALEDVPNNTLGTNARWLVTINNHVYKIGVPGT